MVKHTTQIRKYIYIIYMAENKYKTITYDRYRNLIYDIIHKLKIVRHKKVLQLLKLCDFLNLTIV